MEIRTLRYFLAVAREENMTRVGAALCSASWSPRLKLRCI